MEAWRSPCWRSFAESPGPQGVLRLPEITSVASAAPIRSHAAPGASPAHRRRTSLSNAGAVWRGIIPPERSVALSTHEILHRLEQNAPVIRRYGVRSLGLFGSGARGTARQDSDLDFVVEFETKSFDAYMDLKAFLERLLGCPVDLVLREAIKPRLRETILKEALHAPGL